MRLTLFPADRTTPSDTECTMNTELSKTAQESASSTESFKTWLCAVCGLLYDEQDGRPEEGILAGTRWEDVPGDWICPDCGCTKDDFEMVEV